MSKVAFENTTAVKRYKFENSTVFLAQKDPNYANALFIGIDVPDREVIDHTLTVGVALIPSLENELPEGQQISRIVFIPTFDDDGKSRVTSMDIQERCDFARKCLNEGEDVLNSRWKKFKLDKYMLTGMVPMLETSGVFGFYKSDVVSNYTVPESMREKLVKTLSAASNIPAERYFASNQIVSVKETFNGSSDVWNDFYEQAESKFFEGMTFTKHAYDQQTLKANKFHIPMYGIFVSAYMPLPRNTELADYLRFFNGFNKTFLDSQSDEADAFFHEISPTMFTAGLSIMNPQQLIKVYNNFSGSLVQKAESFLKENIASVETKKAPLLERILGIRKQKDNPDSTDT